jgi:hypothetical protein
MSRALALAVIGAMLWAAAPAMAQSPQISVSGSAKCRAETTVIIWQVTNGDVESDVVLLGSSRPAVVPADATIPAGSTVTFTETMLGSTSIDQTLTLSWGFTENVQSTTATVALNGSCAGHRPPAPTAPPIVSVSGPGPLAFTGMDLSTALLLIFGLVITGLGSLGLAWKVNR